MPFYKYEYFTIYPGNICNFGLDKCIKIEQIIDYKHNIAGIDDSSVIEWYATNVDVIDYVFRTFDIESIILTNIQFDRDVRINLPDVRTCILQDPLYNYKTTGTSDFNIETYDIINNVAHKIRTFTISHFSTENAIDLFDMINMNNVMNLGIIYTGTTKYVQIYDLSRCIILNNICLLYKSNINSTPQNEFILIPPSSLTQLTCNLKYILGIIWHEQSFLDTLNLMLDDEQNYEKIAPQLAHIKCMTYNYAEVDAHQSGYNIKKQLHTSTSLGTRTKMAIR
jgi:hypothetical protein